MLHINLHSTPCFQIWRFLPSLRSVINALVPTQDGRSVSSDQMDAFILMFELAYREILLIEHTEGPNVNHESAKQYIRMALNVLREAMDTARRVLYALSTTGGNEWNRWAAAIFRISRLSRISRGKPFHRSSNCRDDRRVPSNGASAYGRIWLIHIVAVCRGYR